MIHASRILALGLVGIGLAWTPGIAGSLDVISVEPAAQSLANPVNTTIAVHLSTPVNPATVTSDSFKAFGRWSGPAPGSFQISGGNQTVTLIPDHPFVAGETVMVILSHDLQGADGSLMRAGGYSYQFWTKAASATRQFTEIDRMTTRTTPAVTTRAYGGIATDLNDDRYPDLTIVQEDSADLRVFMNKADGTGLYHPFTQPTFPVGDRASPAEPADFDGDGNVDICVANINDDSVSILLGNGDGTYAPQQQVAVGGDPRGIAVLDADGDGDADIVNTNATSGALNMTILFNDGNGVFDPATFFKAGDSNAWALAVADMDEDGLLDLVIGARSQQRILVQTGDGDGTFSLASAQDAGGQPWMVALGDVDDDGHADVNSINSTVNNGSMLFGDGLGGLSTPDTYNTDLFGLATDLGDIDGDGDLDWIASSFDGDWWLFLNDGAGNFTFDQEFQATQAASCALMVDFDNDGDLDLVLIDELEDEVILQQNDGIGPGASPPGVPDGSDATTALTVAKLDPTGSDLAVSWDATTCTGAVTGYQIIYGVGSDLPSSPGGTYAIDGSVCDIGTAPPYDWLGSPDPTADLSSLIWFLVVATDGDTIEGAWGDDGAGNRRSGAGANGASDECSIVDRSLSNLCGQ